MIGYLDSSVLLRIILNESGKIKNLSEYSTLVSSDLLRVECMRVLYRLRNTGHFDDKGLSEKINVLQEVLQEIQIVPVSRLILNRATLPMPTAIGTLDAIHLVTAQLWQERKEQDLVLLSHDVQLCTAAKASGIQVGNKL